MDNRNTLAELHDELLRAAKAVAFSNGFDAALPDKMETLRAVVHAVLAAKETHRG